MMVEKYKVANTTCPPCFIACGHLCRVADGPLAGLEIEGPEFETIYSFGGLCDIADFPQIMPLADTCDRLGVDTMTAGNLCGLAIEACRRGKLNIGLQYGDAQGVAEFLRTMCMRSTATGGLFAEGVRSVEKELGLEGVAVHVKGMEPAGYDPRRSKGVGLGYIVSARGACHLRATFMRAEFAGLVDIDKVEGKAAMYVDWEDRCAIMDCMVYCRFYRDLLPWPYLSDVVNAVIGVDYSVEDYRRIANTIITESHEFNRQRGFDASQERLPAQITERPLIASNGEELRTTAEELELMRGEYYAQRGWDAPRRE